jgi:hypothetical protein
MSGPKTKSTTNGTKKSEGPISQDNSPVASAPVLSPSSSSAGKPDKAAHDAELQRIKAEIDGLQEKLVCHISCLYLLLLTAVVSNNAQTAVKEKISLVTRGGQGNEKRNALRAQLDELRSQQSGNKTSRSKIFEQIKTLQDGIQKKVGPSVHTPFFSLLHNQHLLDKGPSKLQGQSKIQNGRGCGRTHQARLLHFSLSVTCSKHGFPDISRSRWTLAL